MAEYENNQSKAQQNAILANQYENYTFDRAKIIKIFQNEEIKIDFYQNQKTFWNEILGEKKVSQSSNATTNAQIQTNDNQKQLIHHQHHQLGRFLR